jgi:hypothetical protein
MKYFAFVNVGSVLDIRWKRINLRSGIFMGVNFTLTDAGRYESPELSPEQVSRLTAKPLDNVTVQMAQNFQGQGP